MTPSYNSAVPSAGRRDTLAQSDVAGLCALAAEGLVQMLDPEKQLFCNRLNRTEQGLVREGLSQRYTIMCLLGLHRFQAGGPQRTWVDTKCIFNALLADLAWVDNVGDLGLLIWLCAVVSPARLEEIYSKMDVANALSRFSGAQNAVTMEVAWFLTGLAHAALVPGQRLPDLDTLSSKACSLLAANQGNHGTFGHQARSSGLGSLRSRIGSFADQVYPIYAFAKFGEAYQDQPALDRARNCADAICRAQGSLGQWWWHYDAFSGKVFQRYPVYSVHQHGMAPLALFELGDVTGMNFRDSISKGLKWIDGNNELKRNMRDSHSNVVWRSVYRGNTTKMYLREFADFLKDSSSPVSDNDLKVTFECRPYELGWLLYAFGGRHRNWVS
jgi:hypothetical protein